MNDLFSSSSFKKYADLKRQSQLDIESGMMSGEAGEAEADLGKFFEEVENVKEDLSELDKLYKRLHDLNEEAKTAHNANTVKALRAKMDQDVELVLRRAKLVKLKLEALDRSNIAHRNLTGCGPGSSVDRTRISVVSGLGNKLKDLMDDFQTLRGKISAEYKETVERRYFTVTGQQADEQTIEKLISTGESETLVQRAIHEQGRGQVTDTISEIQERHGAVKEMERSLVELHQVFLDMAALVEAQGHQLNNIESHIAHASSFVRKGTEQLVAAKELQRSSRKCTCIAIVLVLVIIILIAVPILASMKR